MLLFISLAIIVAGLIAFWQVTQSDFIHLDDTQYVKANSHIHDGLTLEGIRWAFTTGHASNWHPLTWISHMLDVELFGLRAGWHHFTNLLFHLANTVLLFLVLHRMTKALWQSVFVAALFALHPLHVESVAWVAERKDVLSTLFWMLTMGAYVSYVERPGFRRYVAVLVCYALGLMAKPMLVTLPFVLLLLDYWPLQRLEHKKPPQDSGKPLPKKRMKGKGEKPLEKAPTRQPTWHWPLIRHLLGEKIPLFMLAAGSSIVTFLMQQHGGAVESMETLPLGTRVANAFISYISYIGKMLWPSDLAVFYPHPGQRPIFHVLGAAVLLIAITGLATKAARKRPYAIVGWLWYLGTLVPVIGIVQVGMQAMADRYTYIPLIGLFILVTWAVPDLLEKWPHRKPVLMASSALCLICLFFITYRQVGYWKDSLSLFDHTLEVTDRNRIILSNRGVAYYDLQEYALAVADFNKAIEIKPGYVTYNNRALAYIRLGKFTHAIADLNEAVRINPMYADAYNSRGMAYNSLGRYAEAIADFDRAIVINPSYGDAYNNRGVALGNLNREDKAIPDFSRAIEINPRDANAHNNRGIAYETLGKHERAIADFDKAIEINPKYADAHWRRGSSHLRSGNYERAIEDIKTAARLGEEGAKHFLRNQGIGW